MPSFASRNQSGHSKVLSESNDASNGPAADSDISYSSSSGHREIHAVGFVADLRERDEANATGLTDRPVGAGVPPTVVTLPVGREERIRVVGIALKQRLLFGQTGQDDRTVQDRDHVRTVGQWVRRQP